MRSRYAVVIVLSLVFASCGAKRLPNAPSELTEGIVIYENSHFRGESALITSDVPDLAAFRGPCQRSENSSGTWSDCASSIKIAPGFRATLYGDTRFRGSSLEVVANVPDLRIVSGGCDEGLNDCVSSIRVVRQ